MWGKKRKLYPRKNWVAILLKGKGRNTRWNCDWSSDVCSSDLKNEAFAMFEMLIQGIDDTIVHRIYKFHMQKPPHAEAPKTMITKPAGRDNSSVSQQQP